MYPTREQGHILLEAGGRMNPGPWVMHSYATAECAERIAAQCGLDTEKAYLSGLLHDIGRRFGFTYLRHTIDGYRFLRSIGYHEVSRICITHVFSTKSIKDYIGDIDVTDDELDEIIQIVQNNEFDDYDLLIQLCDTLVGITVMDMHARMADVERRYGRYAKAKHDAAEHLKAYFENLCGDNIYKIITDDESLWGL